MKCPHCGVEFHAEPQSISQSYGRNPQGWRLVYFACPRCQQDTVHISKDEVIWNPHTEEGERRVLVEEFQAYPKAPALRSVPAEVPEHLRVDFLEACAVLPISPKASAALSRRCLQGVLHSNGINRRDLKSEIDEAIASPGFPSSMAQLIHSLRELGNVSAHPKKEAGSGAIVNVEPCEAEWLLDLLEDLFDHYFVKPAKHATRKAELDRKLAALRSPRTAPHAEQAAEVASVTASPSSQDS